MFSLFNVQAEEALIQQPCKQVVHKSQNTFNWSLSCHCIGSELLTFLKTDLTGVPTILIAALPRVK